MLENERIIVDRGGIDPGIAALMQNASPKVWCRLPREGVFVLEVRHTPATASATLPVFVSTTGSVSTASNNNNIPVVKGDSTPLVGSEISAGNRYWVYYNKCDNVIQVMNHYTVAAAPAA